jgi:bacillithiol biosynthesis cysteine-adding enzyme BshC
VQFNLSEIDFLSSATRAFVTNQEDLKNLFGEKHPFYDIEGAISGKLNFEVAKRKVLTKELNDQYNNIGVDSNHPIRAVIKSLDSANTFTVTTGQQLHPCLGPVFVLYKIMDVIHISEDLKVKYPQYNFVPVFWMASEDHDYEEIKKINIFNHEFIWDTNKSGAVGRYKNQNFDLFFNQILSQVNLNEYSIQKIKEIQSIYESSETFAIATAKLVHQFFGDKGLIVIDADSKEFKRLFQKEMIKDIIQKENEMAFNDFSKKIESKKFSLQLSVRPINFFYLDKGIRNRIELMDKKYVVKDTNIDFSEDELLNLIENNPEKLSPNAALRPLYQESILPNIMYVGGNAEVNYWLQLKEVFVMNRISPPKLNLRSSYWIINKSVQKWLDDNQISSLDMLKKQNSKERHQLLHGKSSKYPFFLDEFDDFRNRITDYTSQQNLQDFHQLVDKCKEIEKLIKKLDGQFYKKQNEASISKVEKLDKIHNQYFNLSKNQERNQSLLEFLINTNFKIEQFPKNDSFLGNNGAIISF